MNKKTVWALFSAADGEAVRPILEALEKKGFRVKTGSAPRRGGVALLFLSAAFAADEELQQRFFAADSAGCGIIPLDLDGAPQSELARSALIAKNAITAAGRTSDELAARVASADAFASERRRLPRLLLAAALLLVLGAGFWIWRSLLQKQESSGPSVPALSESSLAAARRLGLTPEDLAAIESFTVVGDAHGQSSAYFTTNSTVNPGLRVYLRDLAYDSEDDGGRRWYSTKDGHEFTLTHYDDLSVIELMPNLHSLTLVLVEADKLPELKALDNLDELRLENCRLGSLDWAAGSSVMTLFCRSCDIEDFSALGSMPRLREAVIELDAVRRADFSGAAATELRYLEITARGNLDEIGLSGFSASALRELTLEGLPLRDIAFLEGLEELEKLELKDLPQLRGIEPVASLSALDHLWMNELPRR